MLRNVPLSTQILFVIALLAGSIAVYTVIHKNTDTSHENLENPLHTLDTSKVSLINISGRLGDFSLEKMTNGSWSLNKKPADNLKITQLLVSLTKIKIKREVYLEKQPQARAILKNKGISIFIWDRKNKPLGQCTLLPDSANPFSAIGYFKDSEVPMLMEMPGVTYDFTEYISPDSLFYADKTLFSKSFGTIECIGVRYKENPEDNFTIENIAGTYKIREVKLADTLKLNSYVQLFDYVTIKNFPTDVNRRKLDSLDRLKPEFEIFVNYSQPKWDQSIRIYYTPKSRGPIFAIIQRPKRLVTIYPKIFDYILQKKDFFMINNSRTLKSNE